MEATVKSTTDRATQALEDVTNCVFSLVVDVEEPQVLNQFP